MGDDRLMMPPPGYEEGDVHQDLHKESDGCEVDPACLPIDPHRNDEGGGSPALVGLAREPESPRASALNEARDLITGDRNNQYGPPTQDFKRAAELLQACGYRRVDANDTVHDIVPSDVAIMVMQVKVSRLMHSRGKRDSWVDLAGYAACGYECAEEEQKNA